MGLMVNGRIVTNGIMRAVSRMRLNNPSVQCMLYYLKKIQMNSIKKGGKQTVRVFFNVHTCLLVPLPSNKADACHLIIAKIIKDASLSLICQRERCGASKGAVLIGGGARSSGWIEPKASVQNQRRTDQDDLGPFVADHHGLHLQPHDQAGLRNARERRRIQLRGTRASSLIP